MGRFCIFVLASSLLAMLPLALGGDRAAAIFSCGMFDGKFQCRASSGGIAHGKNVVPGESESPEAARQGSTDGTWQGTATPPAGKVLRNRFSGNYGWPCQNVASEGARWSFRAERSC